MAGLLLLLCGVDLVADGRAALGVEHDGSPAARHAADLLRRQVVLLAGVALPEGGGGPALRFETDRSPGYSILEGGGGVLVRGDDPVRAVYDLLEGWGCRFDGPEPEVPRRGTLRVEAAARRRKRDLFLEAGSFDPSIPARGVAVDGLAAYRADALRRVREMGYEVRVASTTFDDFLPLDLFEAHPEWFALRSGKRVARGNFALLDPRAREEYLGRLGAWLEAHPEVDCVGIWPEVTSVWDDDALAAGAAESYALLWREAAARHPGRRFEVLATGLTLEPPGGAVPGNVEVRFRPGRAASGLQGIAGQDVALAVRAWEARGARVVLEIDAQPRSWCGLPWPCHDAVREDARRFSAAVLRGGRHALARLWRDPSREPEAALAPLLERARRVRSWGDPADAADLVAGEPGMPGRVAAVERLLRVAAADGGMEERASALADAYLAFQAVLRDLPPQHAATYRRFRGREVRRLFEELLPGGVTYPVGPASVRETLDRIDVETDRLRLLVDRAQGAVVAVQRRIGNGWSANLAGGDGGHFFGVVALRGEAQGGDGDVEIASPDTGLLRLTLSGALRPGGPRWTSVLDLASASGTVRQTARVGAAGGLAVACRWRGPVFDRWVCPAYAAEGALEGERVSFRMPPGTLLWCRDGEEGPGLALRLPRGATATLVPGEAPMLVATGRGNELVVDWILFTDPGELGR